MKFNRIDSLSPCASITLFLLNDFLAELWPLKKNVVFLVSSKSTMFNFIICVIHTFSMITEITQASLVTVKLHFSVIYPSVCLSVCLSVRPSVHLSVTKIVLTSSQKQLVRFHPYFTGMICIKSSCAYSSTFYSSLIFVRIMVL